MTKQEFYGGKPFTFAGRDFRFELIGTDGLVCVWSGGSRGDWQYYASVEIPSCQADVEKGLIVWAFFFGQRVEFHIIFSELKPSTAKYLAAKTD